MASWQRVLGAVAYNVEEHFDRLKYRLRARLGRLNDVIILPYRGFGTAERVSLRGRVIEDRGVISATDNDSVWRNLLNMYRRFASEEIAGATVRATFGATCLTSITDRDGFFDFNFRPDPALLAPDRAWYEVDLELIDYPGPRHEATRQTAQVMIPPPDAQYGVISDLDDTVIRSDAYNLLKLARNTFLKNAHTRLPFVGVAAFYAALQAGARGGYNPIFYVSSGPWNLYDLITDFFEVRGIPTGPLFMARLGPTQEQLIKPNIRRHKLRQIRRIMGTYRHLPFILVGDSGEIDAEVYLAAAREHPGRVAAIYIRDVSGSDARKPALRAVVEAARAAGAEMLVVPDTRAAAEHAAARGFILPDALPDIGAAAAEDTADPDVVERLIDDETAT